MKLIKEKDFTRTPKPNDKYWLYRNVDYSSSDGDTCRVLVSCLINFYDKEIHYTVTMGKFPQIDAFKTNSMGHLCFSVYGLSANLSYCSAEDISRTIDELQTVKQAVHIIEEVERHFSYLREIDGEWTIEAVTGIEEKRGGADNEIIV